MSRGKGVSNKMLPKEVLYISPNDYLGEQLKIDDESPKILRAANGYKFIKNARGIVFNVYGRTVVRWFGKVATAWTHELSDPKAIKEEYNIWDIIQVIFTDDELKKLTTDAKDRLQKSEVKITVGIKEGVKPDYAELDISEQELLNESNKNMAKLIGETVEDAFRKEDYIKILAIGGAFIALTYILQGFGILPKF